MPAPAIGTIVDDYRYVGGDPNSKKSWEYALSAPRAEADEPLAPLTPGAEARTRLALGLGPSVSAQRQMYKSEKWNPGAADPKARLGRNPYTEHPIASALEVVPFDGGAAARTAGGQDYQDYQQSAKSFESSFLPILSGAAVTPSEAQRMIRANLPQYGDTPQILARKSKNRAQMINAAADLLGRPRPFPKVGTWDFQAPQQGASHKTAAPASREFKGKYGTVREVF